MVERPWNVHIVEESFPLGPPLSLIVLGSGTSQGVPLIGCSCKVCTSVDPRDHRFRASVFLTNGKEAYLIDTAPELRLQCLREGIEHVDAVLYTHAHADHTIGFDDLRRFCDESGKPIPILGPEETLVALQRMFPYAFDGPAEPTGYVRAVPHAIRENFLLGSFEVSPLPVIHGKVATFGYLFCASGRKLLAYVPDCHAFTEEAWCKAQGVEVLIIDGLRDHPHPTHLSSSEALRIAERLGAGFTLLTHLTHHASHRDRSRNLPPTARVAYDGLRLRWTERPYCIGMWGPQWRPMPRWESQP
ncbi:MBL fold metallo-hydrolase [Candidatus Methylacidithermus pantelleriae]|uniref:Metal-dependent hydrolases of the beta-lactamase superfamily I PhnP protein n=1 Tax=Candidatus Methylacidithermus pantelleriae TaxID=2744239 RepID=A0A8J2BR49_9BACT|nr:MBL fold metallo-hydrolase [Candidatus Methylacidithermus pantelleriae]CAF0700814.1 Metal-dependent hydrolases of the beta-lactamase superfamily I; PhnP protein [Candidatus Methylacidithermus pantelleriae]